jgi:putative methyltransferase (TIGR04325 family)
MTGTRPLITDPVRKFLRAPMVGRVARWANKLPFIWEGIYADYNEVPVVGDGFAGDVWLSDMERYTSDAISSLKSDGVGVPQNVPQYHALFSLLVASIQSPQKQVRVLDFGGGMGIAFANLLRTIVTSEGIDYWIVDNDESCKRGQKLFEGFSSIRFTPSLPTEIDGLDILVLNSVLQFIGDYREFISTLAALRSANWLFTFLPAGDIPTFASAQKNVPSSVIPVWFFNQGELVEILNGHGYDLVFRSSLDRVFDMSNFPASHQLPRQCNLLFRRR